ncbi:MAG TPA: O-antigen ligase family protein, partial [Clostridiales bacterium]|nr:O-antigen ligase family protein [Clostridiales bacterium]
DRDLASNNAYAGITNQTGVNSYYITVFILITFCILITRSKSNTSKSVIFDFILFLFQGLGFFALILTKRRISLIVAVVCLFIITLVSLERNKKNYKIIGVFIGLISLFALLFLYSSPGKSFFERISLSNLPTDSQRTLFEILDYYSSGRLVLWKDSYELIKQRPWFGWGWFSALDLITQFGKAEIPHNAFIQVFLELGIIGLFAYLSLISYCTYHLIVSLKNEISIYSLFALGLHVLFLLWSMTENAIWDGFPFFMYILSYSLLTTQIKQTSISYV